VVELIKVRARRQQKTNATVMRLKGFTMWFSFG
jgi:hypothetical protein